MNNPQTPLEAAYQAVDVAAKEGVNVIDAAILAFLQWFENEPEGVAEAMSEKEMGAPWDKMLEGSKKAYVISAQAVIQHLKSMVG